MHRIALLLAVPALCAGPLAAQFEGTITMKMNVNAKDAKVPTEMTWTMKGQRMAYSMESPMAPGVQMRIVIDQSAGKMTMLMPMTGQMAAMAQMPGMADAKGLMMVTDLNKAAANAGGKTATPTEWKDLGTSESIAGYKCEDFQANSGKDAMNMCLSKDLGSFTFAGAGALGRGRQTTPTWSQNFPKDRGFPLKVWSPDGKVSMEVTSVQKGSVPESAFAIPDGYKDMSAMLSGMTGRGGRGGDRL